MWAACKVLFVLTLGSDMIGTALGHSLPMWLWAISAAFGGQCYRYWAASISGTSRRDAPVTRRYNLAPGMPLFH